MFRSIDGVLQHDMKNLWVAAAEIEALISSLDSMPKPKHFWQVSDFSGAWNVWRGSKRPVAVQRVCQTGSHMDYSRNIYFLILFTVLPRQLFFTERQSGMAPLDSKGSSLCHRLSFPPNSGNSCHVAVASMCVNHTLTLSKPDYWINVFLKNTDSELKLMLNKPLITFHCQLPSRRRQPFSSNYDLKKKLGMEVSKGSSFIAIAAAHPNMPPDLNRTVINH